MGTTEGFTSLTLLHAYPPRLLEDFRSVEVMVHPGDPNYDEETALLRAEWWCELLFPVQPVSYEAIERSLQALGGAINSMALTSTIKDAANRWLSRVNVNVVTLTAERAEAVRLRGLRDRGQFTRAAYPVLSSMRSFSVADMTAAYYAFKPDLDRLMAGDAAPGKFKPINDFYRSPDAEILYLMIRKLAPRNIVEIGSGNSTRIVRQAISDGRLDVRHVAIDPAPRDDIRGLVDHAHLARFEDTSSTDIIARLGPGDVLFVDSSHEVRVANDVALLFCNVLPALAKGVVVHVHDIFLPFDYPEEFAFRFPHWGEQYILQVHLAAAAHELLWPGAYVQRLVPEATGSLPFMTQGLAQSLWFAV